MSRWWGAGADRGDTERLEAFSDGVLAIAITLLILDVRVEVPPGTSLATALGHALPEIGAYAASFLQIGIIWANHHALFRVVNRVDQLMLCSICCCWASWPSCRCPPGWWPSTPWERTRGPRAFFTAPR
ncbi:MAG: TMEM175 family protein [Pseudonocardiaceae bacterium]